MNTTAPDAYAPDHGTVQPKHTREHVLPPQHTRQHVLERRLPRLRVLLRRPFPNNQQRQFTAGGALAARRAPPSGPTRPDPGARARPARGHARRAAGDRARPRPPARVRGARARRRRAPRRLRILRRDVVRALGRRGASCSAASPRARCASCAPASRRTASRAPRPTARRPAGGWTFVHDAAPPALPRCIAGALVRSCALGALAAAQRVQLVHYARHLPWRGAARTTTEEEWIESLLMVAVLEDMLDRQAVVGAFEKARRALVDWEEGEIRRAGGVDATSP